MKHRALHLVSGALLFCTGAAAYAQADSTTTKPILQAFEFGNDGLGIVAGVTVDYAGVTLPIGGEHKRFGPLHRTTFSEIRELPVPDTATIRWTSADGQQHELVAPIRSFIQDMGHLYGFRFFFVDDHVDIYLLRNRHPGPGFPDVERIKVFPPAKP
jgi:hypothetical protein